MGKAEDESTSFFKCRLPPGESEALFQRIMNEGFEVSGDAAPPIHVRDIPWFNEGLWKKGQDFARENMLACSLALAISYCYGLGTKSAGQVFYRGTMLNSPKVCFLALFHNLRTVTNWWWTDITDPESEGAKQFMVIRRIHRLFAIPINREDLATCRPERLSPEGRKMAEDIREVLQNVEFPDGDIGHRFNNWNPKINYCQSEASGFLMGQAAAFLLDRYHFGVSEADGEKLRGYVHLLAVMGRMVGVEDRFNLCLNPDVELYRRVRQVGLYSCKNADEITGFIWHMSFQDFPFVHVLAYPRVMLLGVAAEELDLWKYLRFGERVNLALFKTAFYLFQRYPRVKRLANWANFKYWELMDAWYSGKKAVHLHPPY